MSSFQKAVLVCSLVSLVIAAGLLLTGLYYVVQYLMDSEDNPYRHEYLVGTGFACLYAASVAIFSTLCSVFIKNVISARLFKILSIPGLVLGGSYIALVAGAILHDQIGRV